MTEEHIHRQRLRSGYIRLHQQVKGYDRFTIPGFIQCSSSESHYGSCLQLLENLHSVSLKQVHKAEVFFRSKMVTYTYINTHSYRCISVMYDGTNASSEQQTITSCFTEYQSVLSEATELN